MNEKFNLKMLILFLGTILAFVAMGYISNWIGLLLFVFILVFYKKKTSTISIENFQEFWNVKFQDKVIFYNAPCVLTSFQDSPFLGANCGSPVPADFPVGYVFENFTIDDGRMHYGAYRGNLTDVPYNSGIHLQSQSRERNGFQLYLGVNQEGKFMLTGNRDNSTLFRFVPVDGSKKNVEYGDKLYIQNVQTSKFIQKNSNNNNQVSLSTEKNTSTQWDILSNIGYGKNMEIDWARTSYARQSSLYQGSKFPASYCTDGDPNTFCHSDDVKDAVSPWFELFLPQLVNIKKVRILNRQDCCKDRLGKFEIIIYKDTNDGSTQVFKKQYTASSNQNEFIANDINVIGNRVRVQLSNTGSKRILNLATVSVYGDPVLNTSNTQVQNCFVSDQKNIDWAKVSNIQLSSEWDANHGSMFCIDGKRNTKCATKWEKEPFLLLNLPGFIKISKIIILNRQDGNYKHRLGAFNVIISQDINGVNTQVYKKEYLATPTQDEVNIENLNIVGNKVKIQLLPTTTPPTDSSWKDNGTQNYRLLNLTDVSVYGEAVSNNLNLSALTNSAVDWARTGTPSMSSTFPPTKPWGSLDAYRCIDGDINTFCATNWQKEPWFQVKLQRKINIKSVLIVNRVDCCKDRLNAFTLIISADGKQVYNKQFTAKNDAKDYKIDNINTIGDTVKIMYPGDNRLINLATVSVYGDPVDWIQVGNFKIQDKAQIATDIFPIVNNNGYSLGMWCYLQEGKLNKTTTTTPENSIVCILDKLGTGPNLQYDINNKIMNIYLKLTNQIVGIQVPGNSIMVPHVWFHILIVVSKNMKTVKVFVNGENVKQESYHEPVVYINNQPLSIGYCGGSQLQPAKGKIQQLRFANYPIGGAEIKKWVQDNNPLEKNFENINKLFNELGCPSDVLTFKKHMEKNPQIANYYYYLYENNIELLKEKLKLIKYQADKIISNAYFTKGTDMSPVEFCYGDVGKQILSKINKLSTEIFNTKIKGEKKIPLFNGIIEEKSKLVIGPKMIDYFQFDNFKISFQILLQNTTPETPSHVLSIKFIQDKKHAFVPQIYFNDNSNVMCLDIFTTQGIEQMDTIASVPFNVWTQIEVSFYKGNHVDFYMNGNLIESIQTIGNIMTSNIFEAVLGSYDKIIAFNGKLKNLELSYNKNIRVQEKTVNLLKEVVPLENTKTIQENTSFIKKDFTIHFWIYYLSRVNSKKGECSIVQGIVNNNFFKISIVGQKLKLEYGNRTYDISLPSYFFNQWNYITLTMLCQESFMNVSVHLNDKLLEYLETDVPIMKPNFNSKVVLGKCPGSYIKDLKVSNYELDNIQIFDFMNNKKKTSAIDSKKKSIQDFETEIKKLKTKIKDTLKTGDLQYTCDSFDKIENEWNEFKNKNSDQYSKA